MTDLQVWDRKLGRYQRRAPLFYSRINLLGASEQWSNLLRSSTKRCHHRCPYGDGNPNVSAGLDTSAMPPFIYINGYPGVGKLTVATELW